MNDKKLTLFVYATISISKVNESVYSFMTEGLSDSANFYINGVSLKSKSLTTTGGFESNAIYLSEGDYFLCVVYDLNKSVPFVKIKKSTSASQNVLDYVLKPINFYSKLKTEKLTADSNFCKPDNYTSSDYCKKLIKDGTTLNKSIINKCFTNDKYIGDDKCSSLVNLSLSASPDINKDLNDFLNNEIFIWFYNKLENLGTATPADLQKLNRMFDSLKTINGDKILGSKSVNSVVSYCEPQAGDNFNYPADKGVCSKLYSLPNTKESPSLLNPSIQKINTSFCTKKDSNGKFRYENLSDPDCSSLLKDNDNKLLNSTINSRCINSSGDWIIEDDFCNKLVDENINSVNKYIGDELLQNLINKKNSYAIKETENISDLTKNLKSENYITNQYYNYKDKNEDFILNDKFTNYCLNKDPMLKDSSCKAIFNKYNQNEAVRRTRTLMKNKNCLMSENLMTDLDTEEARTQNKDKCKTSALSSDLTNVGVFGDSVAKHCAVGDNIISKDCQTYYSDINDKLVSSILQQQPTGLSSFFNKEMSSEMYINIIKFILFVIVCVFIVLKCVRYFSSKSLKSNRISNTNKTSN